MGREEYYPQRKGQQEALQKIWDAHPFFDPSLKYLKFKSVARAVMNGQRDYFVNQIRNAFLPSQSGNVVQEQFCLAMNRGINAVNRLCNEHMEGEGLFLIEPVSNLDLFDLFYEAREDFIRARAGRHGQPDSELIFKAYDKIRAFGLGYRVLMIDESPDVLNSLRHYGLLLDWFNAQFEFRDPVKVEHTDFSHSWQTSAGVRVYGNEDSPVGSRLKILGEDGLRYGSILMKMIMGQRHPDEIRDYTGIEFIVEDDEASEELVGHFRRKIRAMERLEKFKSAKVSKTRSVHSSKAFDVTKFILRPPIPAKVEGHLLELIYERVPVEVQILTLAAHDERQKDFDMTHKEYKKRQFMGFFPVIFPREIYVP